MHQDLSYESYLMGDRKREKEYFSICGLTPAVVRQDQAEVRAEDLTQVSHTDDRDPGR